MYSKAFYIITLHARKTPSIFFFNIKEDILRHHHSIILDGQSSREIQPEKSSIIYSGLGRNIKKNYRKAQKIFEKTKN